MQDLVIKPRRLFRGSGTTTAAANRFAGLFNASVGDELLVVWGWHVGGAAAWSAQGFNNQGSIGAIAMPGVPLLTHEAVGPGQIFIGGTPATATLDYAIGSGAGSYLGSFSKMPFAVIPPNWLFGFSTVASAVAIICSFLWQVITAEELYGAEK